MTNVMIGITGCAWASTVNQETSKTGTAPGASLKNRDCILTEKVLIRKEKLKNRFEIICNSVTHSM